MMFWPQGQAIKRRLVFDSIAVPNRRSVQFRFGLRSLFVVVTLASICLGLSMHWIHLRHRLLKSQAIVPLSVTDLRPGYITFMRQSLWLVGEQPWVALVIESPELSYAEAQWAFPEANIYPDPAP